MKGLKEKILSAVSGDLARIENALIENLNPYLDLVGETARHILFSGGKRLRPLLTVLSARIAGYGGDREIEFSTVFEYLHCATLLHDDLVDGASMRRGKPVAHSIYGNSAAVLVGDFLLARALTIAAKTGSVAVMRVIAEITENMSQGEIHQMLKAGDAAITESEYMEVIRRKTAVLMEGACRVGAMVAGAGEKAESALAYYGLHLGIAFQMADDLLDFTADSRVLGKETGADLREGKVTLPVIHALRRADKETRTAVEKMIREKNFSVQDFERLVKSLEFFGGLSYTRKLAGEHVEKAKEALSIFPPSESRQVLSSLADYSLSRNL